MKYIAKSARLLTALSEGKQLTAKQIKSTYKVSNPYDLIHRLRASGESIYLNRRVNSKGNVTMKYRWNAI